MILSSIKIYLHRAAVICACLFVSLGYCKLQAQDLVITFTTLGFNVSWMGDPTDAYVQTQLDAVFFPQHPNISSNVFDSNNKALFDNLYVITDLSSLDDAIKTQLGIQQGPYILIFTKFSADSYVITDYRNGVTQGCPIITGVNGKRLYFTGIGQDLFAGDGDSKEGVFEILGHEGENVDLYLSDLFISVKDKNLICSLNDLIDGYFNGTACPFAIDSDGEEDGFETRFHIIGTNTIIGGSETIIKPTESQPVVKILASILEFVSAPIAIRPKIDPSEGRDAYVAKRAKLSFDDKWPIDAADYAITKRTNGILKLKVEKKLGAPSIDLGNANGSCVFDGGQYVLHTPRTNSMFFVSSMSICYKMLELKGFKFYGLGSSASIGNSNNSGSQNFNDVIIKDGTFSTYPAIEKKDSIDVVANGWYRDYSDLRLPYNTKIDGGTFNNCNVYVCDASAEPGISPSNSAGQRLCRVETLVASTDIDATLGTKLTPIADYGSASLTPVLSEGNYYVYPYLPDQNCSNITEDYIHNWVTVIPLMGVNGLLTMGGNVTVNSTTLDGKPQKNAYMLYTRLNEFTKQYAGISIAGMDAYVRQAISFAGNKEFSGITNSGTYEIANGLYMMFSFKSNEWNTMVAPYDIANIYVLETTETQKQPGETLDAFLQRQGTADGDLAQTIVTSLCPDIFSGKGSGVHMSLTDICRKQLHIEPYKLTPYNPDLSGHGAADSHFYLYEQVSRQLDPDPEYHEAIEEGNIENGFCEWDLETNVLEYSNNWQCVTPKIVPAGTYEDQDGNMNTEPVEVWMKKGRIYSFFLPANSDRYWDGKYLVFEGLGPQTLTGSGNYSYFLPADMSDDPYYDDIIITQGNPTFHNDTIENTSIFIPTRRETASGISYDFVREDITGDPYLHLPGTVYAVMNEANTEAFDIITRQGHPMPRRPQTGTTTEVQKPLVADRLLNVYVDKQTMLVQSFCEQNVSVFTVDGRQLWQGKMKDGEMHRLTIPAGIYVIHGDTETMKIVVK